MDILGPANFGTILLLYRGCPLEKVKLYCHGPVGIKEIVLYREVKCNVLYLECPIREVPVYTVLFQGPYWRQ